MTNTIHIKIHFEDNDQLQHFIDDMDAAEKLTPIGDWPPSWLGNIAQYIGHDDIDNYEEYSGYVVNLYKENNYAHVELYSKYGSNYQPIVELAHKYNGRIIDEV